MCATPEWSIGKPAVLVIIFRQPAANIIETVDRVFGLDAVAAGFDLARDQAHRRAGSNDYDQASVDDVEFTLLLSVALVIMVVFVFLRNLRATMIPGVVVPLSLLGTFGIMYLCGYSMDNLSLMALTISTGFVVDDAIVVIENISRFLEQGVPPYEAAVRGAKGIGFTVISMSVSLIAVFIPILVMGGIVGRLFREFAVTLSAAIAVSLVLSLTTTPMMCAKLLRAHDAERHGRIYRVFEQGFNALLSGYESGLRWVLDHQPFTLAVFFATLALSIYMFYVIPKGFFPEQDTGRMMGMLLADQDTSFQSIQQKLGEFVKVLNQDPAIDHVIAFAGGNPARR